MAAAAVAVVVAVAVVIVVVVVSLLLYGMRVQIDGSASPFVVAPHSLGQERE